MAKRNFKVYADVGLKTGLLARKLSVLDTGAGPNFIRKSELPPGFEQKIRYGPLPNVNDANNNPIKMLGLVDLIVRLGTRIVKISFIVCERLAAPVILGYDFCDRFVEAIYPRKREIEMDDGTKVPITRKPLKRPPGAPPLPSEQEYGHARRRSSPKVHVTHKVTLPLQSQTWVTVTAERHRVNVLQPFDRLYENHSICTSNGVVQIEPDKPFNVLVANFGRHSKTLPKNQVIATLLPHPTAVIPSQVTLAEVLGIAESDADSIVKQQQSPADTDSMAKKEAKPFTVDDLQSDHLPKKHQARIRNMLKRYAHMWDGSLGEINTTEHYIDLVPGSRPFAVPPYSAAPKIRQIQQEEVDRMLRAGVIEPAQSPWASPVVLAPKPDGSLRFCIDYRRLNAVTVKDTYPLPRMDECIDSLGEETIFTTLDCNSGYWQIPVAEADRDKTAIVCHAGLYRHKGMPFGLTNAPATFQRTLDILLSPYKWNSCLVYLDDVIIYSKDIESHYEHVDQILATLSSAGITLKLAKCKLFSDTVKYLGHIIRPGTMSVNEATTAALRQAQPPRTQTELRSFLGLCNVYRRFIRDFAHISAPLNALLKKDKPTKLDPFTADETAAFNALVKAVTEPPVLAFPKPGLPYSLDTDSSEYQVGCALFQTHDDGDRRPIGFFSRSLQSAERNYSVTEKECLAVVWAVTTLRPYVQMEHFTIFTDHSSLRWLMNINDPSGRLMRWRLRLSEFDYAVQCKTGKSNTQADALSRLQTLGETEPSVDDELPCFHLECPQGHCADNDADFLATDSAPFDEILAADAPRPSQHLLRAITAEELIHAQHGDSFCTASRSRLNGGERLPFSLDENRILTPQAEGNAQIVIPYVLRARVLHLSHHSKLAGHPGGRKLYYTLRQHFYWPSMSVDAYATVRNCATCARNRIKLRKHSKRLKLFPARAPLEFVSIDILGELIRTPRGHRYLLVITDRFSKLVKSVPLKKISAAEIAKAFVRHWDFVYGPPIMLLSDNGSQFISKFFRDVCLILGIENVFTTTYHPQKNGQVERFNRTIVASLRHYVAEHPRDWAMFTDALTYAYNTQEQKHRLTGIAPFELVLSPRWVTCNILPNLCLKLRISP